MSSSTNTTNATKPQRSTRSRRALIRATQELLADGQRNFKLQDVTHHADVVMQTLYNHFPTREDLLQAAVRDALDQFQKDMIAVTNKLTDPLEQLSANMRLFGRLPESHPRIAAIILNAPEINGVGSRGYTEEAFAHVESIREAGLINPPNLDLALMGTVASIDRLMRLRAADKSRPVSDVDELAFQNLLTYGLSSRLAAELVARELPTLQIHHQ